MKKRIVTYLAAALAVVLVWFGYAAWRAHGNLVTLDVRDASVRDVARMIERQTWEIILINKEVEGKVTLKVKDAPLEDVLSIITEQTSARWNAIYPLYSTKQSLVGLKQSLRGEAVASTSGWTNLQNRSFMGFGRGGGPGMFADTLRNENKLISLNLVNKDLSVATLALARFGRAHVVPEDGLERPVQLTLQQATMEEAVEQLAKQTSRHWTLYYALLGGGWRGPRRPPGETNGMDTASVDTNAFPGGRLPWQEPTPEEIAARQKQFEAQLETMTPEEKQKALDEQQRREQMRAEMQNMTPEQRRERFAQMAQDPQRAQQMQARMLSGIKNTTPQQRVERTQRMNEMRKRFQESGTPPGRP